MSEYIDLTSDDDGVHDAQGVGRNVVENDEAEEERQLKLAIAMSLQDQIEANRLETEVYDLPSNNVGPCTSSTSTPNAGLAGLDRKAMEVERLARLKRKRETDETDPVTERKAISPPPLSRHKKPTTLPERLSKPAHEQEVRITTNSGPISPVVLTFAEPLTLLTSQPSRRVATSNQLEAISFSEILQPPHGSGMTTKSVLMSSFIIDFDWLLPHFTTNNTSFVFVLHTHNPSHRAALQEDFAGLPNVRLVLPTVMGGGGNMHSKLILLFFQSKHQQMCRIVIPSANLVPYDWGAGKVMENILWVADLPEWTQDQTCNTSSAFRAGLVEQLTGMGVAADVIQKLRHFDFTKIDKYRFVHSCSGSHPVSIASEPQSYARSISSIEAQKSSSTANVPIAEAMGTSLGETGILSLCEAVRSLGFRLSEDDECYPPRLDFITSSLGNLSDDFIRQLFLAACGQSKTLLATKTSKDTNKHNLDELIKKTMKIYFPSAETVRESKGGPNGAGTICFQRKWWEANTRIRDCLHDAVGSRGDGILMHSKILYVRFRMPRRMKDDTDPTALYSGWAYIGSANCSESAWGRVVVDIKTKQPKLSCRNWESGVVIPVRHHDTENTVAIAAINHDTTTESAMSSQAAQKSSHDNMKLSTARNYASCLDHESYQDLTDVFRASVPVPIVSPASHVSSSDRQPWFFMD